MIYQLIYGHRKGGRTLPGGASRVKGGTRADRRSGAQGAGSWAPVDGVGAALTAGPRVAITWNT